jgi:2-methylcitrate dehydratase PrpD
VISAALALAQRDGWTGDRLVRAIVAGYEMSAFLGTAIQQSPGYSRSMRPSGLCGPFGVAAAAVVGSGASDQVAINALAFAANMASGFCEWAWAGGVEIYTEMGFASQSGIDAFELAKAGLEGSETLLEGRAGLFSASGASKGTEIFKECLQTKIGTGIMDVRFKPVPGCNYAQTPLATALKIAREHDLSKGIQSVSVGGTSGAKNYPGCDNPGPKFTTVQQTKMSIQFGVCAVLLHGNVSEELFQKFDSQEISKLAESCPVEAQQEFEQSFQAGRQPARVKVTLRDGSVITEELSDVPWLDADAVHIRYQQEAKDLVGEKRGAAIASLLEKLSDLQDCSEIWRCFRG